jgi:hypothetical protein
VECILNFGSSGVTSSLHGSQLSKFPGIWEVRPRLQFSSGLLFGNIKSMFPATPQDLGQLNSSHTTTVISN